MLELELVLTALVALVILTAPGMAAKKCPSVYPNME